MQQGGGFQDFGSGRQKFDSQAAGQNLHAVDWNKEQLLTIKKDFYVEHPNVKAMTEDQHRAFLQSNDITVEEKFPKENFWVNREMRDEILVYDLLLTKFCAKMASKCMENSVKIWILWFSELGFRFYGLGFSELDFRV